MQVVFIYLMMLSIIRPSMQASLPLSIALQPPVSLSSQVVPLQQLQARGIFGSPFQINPIPYPKIGTLTAASFTANSNHRASLVKDTNLKKYSKLDNTSQHPTFATSATGATMGEKAKVIDHLVYFKVKDDAPEEKKQALADQLRALAKLPGVIFLHFGEALNRSDAGWTHALCARYVSKEALASYTVSDKHVKAVENAVLPINQELMVTDWEAEVPPLDVNTETGVIHTAMLKLKVGSSEGEGHSMVKKVLGGQFAGSWQVSIGENISHRSKGHGWGLLSLHPSHSELQNSVKELEGVLPPFEKYTVVDFSPTTPPISKL